MIKSMLISLCLFSVGCGFLQPNPNVTIEQKVDVVRSLSKTGTFIALNEAYKKDQVKMRQHATEVKDAMNKVLSGIDSFGSQDFDKVILGLINIDEQYKLLIESAFTTFKLYFTVANPTDVLTPDQKQLAVGLVSGVIDGCDLVLLGS